jgi:methionine sulfoxide reductase heme-binding subunit
MTAKPQRRRVWNVLHTAGMYYFWLIFAEEYIIRLVLAEKATQLAAKDTLSYLCLSVLAILGLVIRVLGRKKKVDTNQGSKEIFQA